MVALAVALAVAACAPVPPGGDTATTVDPGVDPDGAGDLGDLEEVPPPAPYVLYNSAPWTVWRSPDGLVHVTETPDAALYVAITANGAAETLDIVLDEHVCGFAGLTTAIPVEAVAPCQSHDPRPAMSFLTQAVAMGGCLVADIDSTGGTSFRAVPPGELYCRDLPDEWQWPILIHNSPPWSVWRRGNGNVLVTETPDAALYVAITANGSLTTLDTILDEHFCGLAVLSGAAPPAAGGPCQSADPAPAMAALTQAVNWHGCLVGEVTPSGSVTYSPAHWGDVVCSDFPTSFGFGGSDDSVNTPAEIDRLAAAMDQSNDAIRSGMWAGLTPADQSALPYLDPSIRYYDVEDPDQTIWWTPIASAAGKRPASDPRGWCRGHIIGVADGHSKIRAFKLWKPGVGIRKYKIALTAYNYDCDNGRSRTYFGLYYWTNGLGPIVRYQMVRFNGQVKGFPTNAEDAGKSNAGFGFMKVPDDGQTRCCYQLSDLPWLEMYPPAGQTNVGRMKEAQLIVAPDMGVQGWPHTIRIPLQYRYWKP